MNVYLDKVRLLDGQRFDVGFIKGLAASAVFTPLMSLDCMKSFADLEQTDREDFVLMEWIVAIELQKRGIVKAIFPIVMGQQTNDGKFEQFFFEKLLHLKGMMKTSSGRRRAEDRHSFMLTYLDQLRGEIEGSK